MDGALVIFGHWLQNRSFALAIAGSDWAYPLVQATHFTGLSLWVGTIVAVDLSLLGIGKKSSAPLPLSDALFLWNWIGFAIAVTRWISPLLRFSRDLCRQHRLPDQARPADSFGARASHCRSAKSPRVGESFGNSPSGESCGLHGVALVALCRHCGGLDPIRRLGAWRTLTETRPWHTLRVAKTARK